MAETDVTYFRLKYNWGIYLENQSQLGGMVVVFSEKLLWHSGSSLDIIFFSFFFRLIY
jgi:hypothetical protein